MKTSGYHKISSNVSQLINTAALLQHLHIAFKIFTTIDLPNFSLQKARCKLMRQQLLKKALVNPLFVRLPIPLAWSSIIRPAFPSFLRAGRCGKCTWGRSSAGSCKSLVEGRVHLGPDCERARLGNGGAGKSFDGWMLAIARCNSTILSTYL